VKWVEKHQKWTDEEHQALTELVKKGLTYQQIADELSKRFGKEFTFNGVRNRLRRTTKNKISYADRKNISDNIEDYIQHLIRSQEELQQFDDRQTSVTLDIDDNKPIGIVFTGDWHVGGLYTDHKQMLKDFETIKNTDGLYNIGMGDYADNYISSSHKGGQYEQITTPEKQKELIEYLFTKYLGENNIAILKGNHDNWEYKETGEDFVKYLARLIESPYLWYGGEINIRLGNQVYKIIARHTYLGNSALNTTNSQRRLFDETQGDVIALGHLHFNESHAKSKAGKDTVWIRTGTYKVTDDYTQWVIGGKGDTRQPMVILFPDEKKIIDFRDMYDGIKFLKVLRGD
jgi:predicted phosphodiesterase